MIHVCQTTQSEQVKCKNAAKELQLTHNCKTREELPDKCNQCNERFVTDKDLKKHDCVT